MAMVTVVLIVGIVAIVAVIAWMVKYVQGRQTRKLQVAQDMENRRLTMDTTARVEKFLRDRRRETRYGIIVGILFPIGIMLFVVLSTDDAPVGSLRFFGLLLTILAFLFYIGMMYQND